MGENIINSRTISAKLNCIFSWLVMYQGMMTFVLMAKELGIGLCFLQIQEACGVATPACRLQGPCLEAHTHRRHTQRAFFFFPVQSLLTRFYLKHARLRSEQTSLCRSSRGHSAAAAGRARQKSKVQSKGPTPWTWGLSFEVISISLCLLINEMESKRREWLCLPVFLKGEPHVLLHLLETMVVGVNQVERQRVGQGAVPPPWRHP